MLGNKLENVLSFSEINLIRQYYFRFYSKLSDIMVCLSDNKKLTIFRINADNKNPKIFPPHTYAALCIKWKSLHVKNVIFYKFYVPTNFYHFSFRSLEISYRINQFEIVIKTP